MIWGPPGPNSECTALHAHQWGPLWSLTFSCVITPHIFVCVRVCVHARACLQTPSLHIFPSFHTATVFHAPLLISPPGNSWRSLCEGLWSTPGHLFCSFLNRKRQKWLIGCYVDLVVFVFCFFLELIAVNPLVKDSNKVVGYNASLAVY